MPEMQRGTGPDALPQGAAQQLNRSAAPAAQQPNMAPDPADIPVEYANPPKIASNDLRSSENNQLLTAPAEPNFRAAPGSEGGKIPRSLVRYLPIMGIAAKDPAAPRSLQAFYEAAVAALDQEVNGAGP